MNKKIIFFVYLILFVFMIVLPRIIVHKTFAQSSLISPIQTIQQNSETSPNQLNIILNLFKMLFSVPDSINTDTDFELPTPTSTFALPTPFIPSGPITPTPYIGTTTTGNLFPNPLPPVSTKALSFQSSVAPCQTNRSIYNQASAATGVPWHVLASIHFIEGRCRPTSSLVSGWTIGTNEPDVVRAGGCTSARTGSIPVPLPGGGCGFNSLLDSAKYAGIILKGKIGKIPETFEDVVKAFSRYNGGGNRNCGRTLYTFCPREFYGEDDPYALNYFDQKHETMYLVYCADSTPCNPPRNFTRPGAVTFMRLITNQ